MLQDGNEALFGDLMQVRIAWSGEGASDNDVIVRAFNDLVTQGSMRTLRDGEWLGDEVLPGYNSQRAVLPQRIAFLSRYVLL